MNFKRFTSTMFVGIGALAAITLLGLLERSDNGAITDSLRVPVGGPRASVMGESAASPLADTSSVRFVALTGTDEGDCTTPASACRTIQYAVDRAVEGGEIRVAAGAYTDLSVRPRDGITSSGLVTQVVYLSKTVTIRGGYTTTNWTTPHPKTQPTRLDAQGQGRVLYITGSVSPTIEGLRITGGDAKGLGGSADNGGTFDSGGGVYIITSSVTIRDSDVFSNTADVGGGVFLLNGDALLSGNTVTANSADNGGGLYLQNSNTVLSDNTITANIAQWAGAGLYLDHSGVTLNENTIASNIGHFSGGLHLDGADATLSGNIVISNTGNAGGGLYLEHSSAESNGDTIRANEASRGAGLFLGFSDVGLTNDLIVDNRASLEGSGLYNLGSTARLVHTTIARNTGGIGSGLYAIESVYGDPSSVALTNTILVSHSVGIIAMAGSTATLEATLWGAGLWANQSDWGGTGAIITGSINLWAEPVFLDPAAGDYHIHPASAAMDAGIDAGANTDLDGHHRPYNSVPDLGADEIIATSVPTDTSRSLVYTDTLGSGITIQLPTAVVTEAVTLVYTPLETATAPSDLSFAGHIFSLEAYRDGASLPGFAFEKPITITVHYTADDVAGLDENTLELRHWDGSAWVDAAATCAPPSSYERWPREDRFALPICHLSRFATFGSVAEYPVFLPLVRLEILDEPEPPPLPPPAPPAGFARWRSADGEFNGWERDGVRLASDGRLELDLATAHLGSDPYPPGGYYGHDFYNGGSFSLGVAQSPIMTASFSFKEGIASWNADTPPGTWIETLVRAQLGDRWTKWYNMGVWAADTSTVERHSVNLQGDGDGYVAVDTLVVTNAAEPVNAYQLELRLFSADGVTVPSLRNASFAFSETLTAGGTLPPGNPDLWNHVLPVPECSQMVYPDGGTVWCSPTSTAMVLKYWAQDTGPCEPSVRAAVAGVYDWLYDGHGNWPFNTAYAATHGLEAYVARLNSLAQAEKWIAADVPLVFSLAWGPGELAGAPLLWSDGHLLVLVGFDADGDPVVNDPAAWSDETVQRTYIREEFESLWLEHTNGTVYLIHPPGWPVPDIGR